MRLSVWNYTLFPSVSSAPVKELSVKIPEVAATDLAPVSPDLLQQAFESAGMTPPDDENLVMEDISPQILDFDEGPLKAEWLMPYQDVLHSPTTQLCQSLMLQWGSTSRCTGVAAICSTQCPCRSLG